jgi:hypothetical protein
VQQAYATGYASSIGHKPRGFARRVEFELTDQERSNLTAFCRHYSIVDPQNHPRSAEAARLLHVIALTADLDTPLTPMDRAGMALRIQMMMAVASMGYRLPKIVQTVEQVVNHPRTDLGGMKIKITYDSVELKLLERYEVLFRDENGKARDELLAKYLMEQGMADPSMHEICSVYGPAASGLHAKIAEMEQNIVQYIHTAMTEWSGGAA